MRIKLILHEIDPDDSVLDIGCVNHTAFAEDKEEWLHKYLYDKAKYVLGIDCAESEVEKLKDRGYNVVVADAENMQLGTQFDVIVAGELIEHLSNSGRFLEGCKEHLKGDGKLVLTTPNVWWVVRMMSVIFRGFAELHEEHTCWYDKKSLNQLLTRHGFKIEKVEFVPAPHGSLLCAFTRWLYRLGLKQLGGHTLFVVCRKRISESGNEH
jgi:2-polyprenyl-3-methyl-5-hydroxy-6-metoxy-1,4-benzoquinol methylase